MTHISALRPLMAAALAAAAMAVCSAAKPLAAEPLTARRVFVDLPATTLDLLGRSARMDMLDYWDADSVYRAPNTMEGRSWLDTVTPGYLKVTLTPVSTLEIKVLLGRKDTQTVMTVYTVGAGDQAPDSEVTFYDAALQPLDTRRLFKAPELRDFFDLRGDKSVSMRDIDDMVPFPTVLLQASADSDSLTAVLTSEPLVDMDRRERLRGLQRPPLVYVWDGARYRLGKQ